MSHFNLPVTLILIGALGTILGCGDPDLEYRYGFDLNNLEFNLHTADMGIYPDTSVLEDPANPFRFDPLGTETKWTIESNGRIVPRFYVWATALASEPIGENQFYAARALEDLYRQERARPEYLPFIKTMTVRAYQSVLDNFPDAVSYLADGVTFFPLNILAYDAIVELGETPTGGWVVVTSEEGDRVLIKNEL